MRNVDNYKSQQVYTSQKGVEYLTPKILKIGPERVSKAILERYKRRGGKIEVVLAIKRFRLAEGEEVKEDPKKDISLDFEEFSNLIQYLSENIEAFRVGLRKYLPVNLDKTTLTGEEILYVLNRLSGSEVKELLENIETSPKLVGLANTVKILKYQQILEEFGDRLTKKYQEDAGEDSWQAWLIKNHWVFGSNYKAPIPKARINIEGSKPDYLFPTVDGYVDAFDIKNPDIPDILVLDSSHKGSYYWSSEINKTIGQVVNYLYDLDENRLKLAEILGINVARPRGIIVAGRSSRWNSEQSRAYRKLSFSLHGIEILTYDHLLERAKGTIATLVESQENET